MSTSFAQIIVYTREHPDVETKQGIIFWVVLIAYQACEESAQLVCRDKNQQEAGDIV